MSNNQEQEIQAQEQELLKISCENIATSVTQHIETLCIKKGFSLSKIPENMLPEAETRINQTIDLLSKNMHSDNRTFVYHYEIETIAKKTIDLFLTQVSAILVIEMNNELLNTLIISADTKQSSKLVMPAEIRQKIAQSNLFPKSF